MTADALVLASRRAFESGGLFAALKVLNTTTNYRFTGIYQFSGKWVKSVWLYDRENPSVLFGSDVLWDDSYCRMTATDGDACEITDSLADPRLTTHAARRSVQCYAALLLRNPDGTALGTLCHYDVVPLATPDGTFDRLRAVRAMVEQALWTELAQPAS